MPARASSETTPLGACLGDPRRFVIWAGASSPWRPLVYCGSILAKTRRSTRRHHRGLESGKRPTPPASLRIDNRRILARILPWFEAQLDPDETEMPTFSWPIQEKSPLMVSTALRPDLFD